MIKQFATELNEVKPAMDSQICRHINLITPQLLWMEI